MRVAQGFEPAEMQEEEEPQYAKIKSVLVNTPAKVETLLRRLANHDGPLGFDTEVVGPQLRNRDTDFVNEGHCVLLGFSLAFPDERGYYVPMRHLGNNASFMDLHLIATEIQRLCLEQRVWAHNAQFDQGRFTAAGYPLPGLLCSKVAAWLVTGRNRGIGLKDLAAEILNRLSPPYDPRIGHQTGDTVKQYACHDALNTLQLGEHFAHYLVEDEMWKWFGEECRFGEGLAQLKLNGIALDRKKLAQVRVKAKEYLAQVSTQWDALAPDISITSSKQLQNLFIEGIWSPKGMTDGGAFSTAGKVMKYNVENAKGDGKRLARLKLDYQEVAKIVTTYTDGLIEEALQWPDKKLHPDLFHFGTVTGRLASSNPNIQNQPVHGDWAHYVRECFIPDPGMEFTSADYSQVELRYFADYCGSSILAAFLDTRAEADLHQRTADAMGITRKQAKTVNFGFLLYGGGPDKLADDLGCSPAEAEMKIEALQAEYPEVDRWKQHVIAAVSGRNPIPWVRTLAGRIRFFPELNPALLRKVNPVEYTRLNKKYILSCRRRNKQPSAKGLEWSIKGRGERLVVNYLIQGGARDLLVMGSNEYTRRAPPGFRIVTTVHDEVLTQHPIGEGSYGRNLLKTSLECVGDRLGLTVPIVAEPKTGSNWQEVKG